MAVWISRSDPGRQYLLSAVCALVGVFLLVGFSDFRTTGTNAMAGFFLGLLLAGISVVGLFATGRQSVVVDPGTRRITVEDSGPFGPRKRAILFGDIVDIGIGFLGKKSNHVSCYYLVLKLRNGKDYPLFAPGRFFAGAADRSIVIGWQQRLQGYLDQK